MPTLRRLLNEARDRVIDGDLAQAQKLCEQVLARFPKHVEAHVLLGEAAREARQYEDARHLFLTALALDPENGIGYWALGLIAEQEGQRELAVSMLERALEYLPGDSDLWRTLRRLREGRPELSVAGLGRLYLRQGLFQRARRELEAALAEQPTRLDVRLALAECLWRMGRIADARRRCEEVLSASPDCLKALLLLADCNRQQRRFAAAERLLRRAAQIDPDGEVGAALFADSEPRWIGHQPVDLDEEATASEEAPERSEPRTWIERLARDAEPARPATEVRLSHWFAEPTESEPVEASDETLLDDLSLAPWHHLLSAEVQLDQALVDRLNETLAELGQLPAESEGEWRDVPLGKADQPVQPAAGDEGPGPTLASEVAARSTDAPSADSPTGRLERARRLQDDGDLEAAVREYGELIRSAPALSAAIAACLREVVSARPADVDAHLALGDAYMACSAYQKAIDEYVIAYTAKLQQITPQSENR